MILIICQACKRGLRVSPGDMSGNVSEAQALFGPTSEFYPDRYPCANCQEYAELIPAAEVAALHLVEIHDVTPHEAFASMNGLGLPEEKDCGATAVQQLLENKRVLSVKADPIRNSHRCILKEITFVDGTKMFLGASSYGATVYRISKPHSYVEALTDG